VLVVGAIGPLVRERLGVLIGRHKRVGFPGRGFPGGAGLVGHEFFNPVTFAIVVAVQADFIIPGQLGIVRIFR